MPTKLEWDEFKEKQDAMYNVLLGIPNTDEKGLVFTVNKLCRNHQRLERTVFTMIGILVGLGSIAGGLQLFGG